jgi:hypothetical protein
MFACMWRRTRAVGDRQANHQSSCYADSLLLRRQLARSKADRGSIRLDQDCRRVLAQNKLRDLAKVDWAFPAAAYDLVRVPKLVGTAP